MIHDHWVGVGFIRLGDYSIKSTAIETHAMKKEKRGNKNELAARYRWKDSRV